jgi:predicted SAM-dependent methyltransferase
MYNLTQLKKNVKNILNEMKMLYNRGKRLILPPKIPHNANNKVYIHLGCGELNDNRFINVDARPFPHVHYVQKINSMKNFPSNYADLIYASHLLEHVSHRKTSNILKQWHRILKKGGILRLSVPDFDKIINIYLSEHKNIKSIQGPLMGGQGYKFNQHKAVFNKDYLKQKLLAVGFKKIRYWNPNKITLHSFNDWASRKVIINKKEYTISLNLEAIK